MVLNGHKKSVFFQAEGLDELVRLFDDTLAVIEPPYAYKLVFEGFSSVGTQVYIGTMINDQYVYVAVYDRDADKVEFHEEFTEATKDLFQRLHVTMFPEDYKLKVL